MPFYRRRITYADAAPAIQKVRKILRDKFPVVAEADHEFGETFLITPDNFNAVDNYEFVGLVLNLERLGYLQRSPWADDGTFCMTFTEKADGPKPTISPSHVRLPKLSYLITFTPEDFFTLFRLLATARNTPSKDSLALNPAAAGIESLSNSPLDPFFLLMRTNYRMNPDYADKKWTSRKAIEFVSTLEPTRDNQLSAMQYLTALQNPDILYFPIITSIELQLDWEQVSDDYCLPPQQ